MVSAEESGDILMEVSNPDLFFLGFVKVMSWK